MNVSMDGRHKLCLQHLAGYARFILHNRLTEFYEMLLQLCEEHQLPVLQHLKEWNPKKMRKFSRSMTLALLHALKQNKAEEMIASSIFSYLTEKHYLSHDRITAEDITLYSWIRRRVFLQYLRDYTTDTRVYHQVVEDLDLFTLAFDRSAYQAFLNVRNEAMSRMNRELQQKQEELLEAQELTDMGSFWWDVRNEESDCTPGVYRIFELEVGEGQDEFMQHVHVEDRPKLRKSVEEAINHEGMYECEFRYIRKHKEKRIWSRGLVSFEKGQPVQLKGIVMDITHKYRLVEQLRQSEQLNKQAQFITHIGNWTWDVATEKITWSDEMYRIYGMEPQSEVITLDRWLRLIHPDDQERRLSEIRQSILTGEATDSIVRIVTDAGETKTLRGRSEVQMDQSRKQVHLIGTCQDVTLEYKLSKEIQEKEKYLQALITNAPDAVVVVDKLSNIQLWNPKMEEIFGWSAKEVKEKNLRDLIIPVQNRASYSEELHRYLETGMTNVLNRTMEIKALNKAGMEFDVALTISPFIQQGKLFFIAFIRDITRQKMIKTELKRKSYELEQVNLSLAQKNKDLEHMNAELESFNYVASHDLKEPLRKIQIFAQRIQEEDGVKPSSEPYFQKIVTAASRMQALIEDLLVFSQANAPENQFEPVDLNEVMDNVCSVLSAVIEEKKAVIERASLPKVKAIAFQMQQLFLNLVSNALKYSDEKKEPVIHIQVKEVLGADIGISQVIGSQTYFMFEVCDNGIGFEEQYAEKIFQLFQRLHNKDQYFGTGIGLAICKKIVYNHHGFIMARGKPGTGAEFVFYLPK